MSGATDQATHADFLQDMVGDLHAKLARWFRTENPDLSDEEVHAACDYMLLHHLLVLAVNRDRNGLVAIRDMADGFCRAMREVSALVTDADARAWVAAGEGKA